MSCKLTSKITKDNCHYTVAGVKEIYLINYDSENEYTLDADGGIDSISLADSDKAYKIDFVDNTASFSDELAVNGNGGKYRTHTVNFTISNYDYEFLNQEKALSLGKFTAVVVDKSNKAIVLGRNNGLSATAFNYASGAADADAYGWTVTMAGTEIEMGRLLKDVSVISAIADKTVVAP
ncbi:hypothetical protein JGH11_13215 [Dysgonomonas sp. Marseille-P4677]|uniref:hypothetical protein n=1 Tax=Dysgonomonas sp. Marseille-P4677 TaxID=2364790 RepID=UPI001912649D|nr:hypothetical protein [Dysgonomonas sp. Marseille-P4677]MBK5721833.1 hypothetical protein [Dysgonomonas sp. Marseille-P4677]